MRKLLLVVLITLLAVPATASVNVISGSLTHRQKVFDVTGGPMSLQFGLTYSNFARVDGELGPGWRHNYELSLHQTPGGTIVFFGGQKKRFFTPETITIKGKNKVTYTVYHPQVGDFSSLEKNSDGTWTLSLRDGTVYIFGTDLKVNSISDRFGNTVAVDDSVTGQTTVTDPSGRSMVFSYNSEGKIISVVNPAQEVYDFNYHPDSGLLWTVTFPAPETGASRPVYEYLYESRGLLEYRRDAEGHLTKYGYDEKGRVVRIVDPGGVVDTTGIENPVGHTKTISYDFPAAGQSTVTEKDGGTWVYSYDRAEGILTAKTDPDGDEISYTYYPTGDPYQGLLHEKIEPVDADTTYVTTYHAYDSFGNLLEISGHARHVIQIKKRTLVEDAPADVHRAYTYDNANEDRLTSVTDLTAEPAAVTTFTYETDTSGLEKITVTDPVGHQTAYRLNSEGRQKDITGPYGTIYSRAYYPNGDLLSVSDASGITTEFLNYDPMGRPGLVRVVGADGSARESLLGYDALDRLLSVTQQGVVLAPGAPPVDLTTRFGYDKVGNRVSIEDAEHNITTYNYNDRGQITSITDAYLQETELFYSGSGCAPCGGGVNNLIALIDPNHSSGDPATAPKTIFSYYPDGKLKSETDPLGNSVIYTYYPAGWLKDKRLDTDGDQEPGDADKMLLSFAYYPDGKIRYRVDEITGKSTEFTYWPQGWLKAAVNPHIGYMFEYYPNGWLKKITDTNGRVISYDAYDGLGQRDLVTLLPGTADEKILDYGYDEQGRLQSITSAAGTFSFGYDPLGRRGKISYPHGISATYSYHPEMNWLSSLSYDDSAGITVESVGYPAHDKVGNRKESERNGTTTAYGYDNLYRLISASSLNSSLNFTYDPAGNRESGPFEVNTAMASYDYDDASRMLLGREDTYEHDALGNRTRRFLASNPENFWEYTWDGGNRMIKAQLKNSGIVERSITFTYDPFGRRYEKIIVEGGNTRTHSYLYDDEDLVLEYINKETGSSLTHYVHGPGIDEPLAAVRASGEYFYHADGLGSIVALTDIEQRVVQRYSYSAFGEVSAENLTFYNPFTFTGRVWDSESGLYFYRSRYYDPHEGRFISKDPLSSRGNFYDQEPTGSFFPYVGAVAAPYRYTENNPLNWIDPMGYFSLKGYLQNRGGRLRDQLSTKSKADLGQLESAVDEVIDIIDGPADKECFETRQDLNGDGELDGYDNLIWFLYRRIWDFRTPPLTPYPPGFGNHGPGSSNPPYGNSGMI